MTDSFFMEVLQSLQTRTRKAAKTEDVLRNRQLIDKYLEAFCQLYRYHLITIPGNSSNLEAYIARQILTSYLNNAEMRSGTHLRNCLNIFSTYELYDLLFDVKRQRLPINSSPVHISPIFLRSKLYYRLPNHMMPLSVESMKYKLWGSISMHSYFLRHG